jgi:hypothetical protein
MSKTGQARVLTPEQFAHPLHVIKKTFELMVGRPIR